MRDYRHQATAFIAVIAAVIVGCMAVSARSGDADEAQRDARKADYFFLEALRQKAAGKTDAYYDLVRAAHALNPSDKYLAKEDGTSQLLMLDPTDTTTAVRDIAFDKIRRYVEANPTDLYAGVVFAQLAAHMGLPSEAVDTWYKLYHANGKSTQIGLNYVDALIADPDSATIPRALAMIDSLEIREGISPDFSIRRLRVFEQMADSPAMSRETAKLLSAFPNDIGIVSMAGRMYMALNKPDSALIYFNRAVEIDPASGAAYYNRAAYYHQMGDSAAYDREVFQAMRQPDLDLEAKLEILKAYVVRLYNDSTQHGRIADLFTQLINQYPHEAEVRNFYTDYLIAVRDFEAASEQKSYELDLDPSDVDGWVMLSQLYFQTDKNSMARDAAMRGTHYFPKNIQLYELAAAAEMTDGRLDEALTILDKAQSIADTADVEQLSSIAAQIGDVYLQKGITDSVTFYYDRALMLNPGNLGALNNYAYYISCREDGDLNRALTMIERVMLSKDNDPTSLDTYAWVLFKMKNYEKAKEIIDKAIANLTDDSAEVLEHAGDIYFMDGEPDEALAFWQKALEIDPDNQLLKRKVKHKTFFYK